MSKLRRILFGTVVAGAVGYVAGILTAPKSGKETREDIKDVAVTTRSEAEKQLKNMHTELDNLLSEAKGRGSNLSDKARKELDDVTSKARQTKDKAREILSALHEGDADDKDLRRAIGDANKALDHIKKYLKK